MWLSSVILCKADSNSEWPNSSWEYCAFTWSLTRAIGSDWVRSSLNSLNRELLNNCNLKVEHNEHSIRKLQMTHFMFSLPFRTDRSNLLNCWSTWYLLINHNSSRSCFDRIDYSFFRIHRIFVRIVSVNSTLKIPIIIIKLKQLKMSIQRVKLTSCLVRFDLGRSPTSVSESASEFSSSEDSLRLFFFSFANTFLKYANWTSSIAAWASTLVTLTLSRHFAWAVDKRMSVSNVLAVTGWVCNIVFIINKNHFF